MNLESPSALKDLAKQIKDDIDNYCITKWNEGPRSHLGASVIGHNCAYYLCLSFRWAFYTIHSASQYRLFQRGHFEEPRFEDYIKGMGCEVRMFSKSLWWHPETDSYFIDDIDFKNNKKDIDAKHCEDVTHNFEHIRKAERQGINFEKGKAQIRISACKGHFGGSTDGQIILPERYGIHGWLLLELKTQGLGKKGKNFEELVTKGVKLKKPQHYAQMSIYGYKLGLQHAVYMAVNKNTDDLHIEVVKLDWFLGESLEKKAEMIIFGEVPPARLSMSPAYFECNYCDAKDYCHNGKAIDKNCRSCKMCEPVDNSEWYCHKWNAVVPKEHIKNGCETWISYF